MFTRIFSMSIFARSVGVVVFASAAGFAGCNDRSRPAPVSTPVSALPSREPQPAPPDLAVPPQGVAADGVKLPHRADDGTVRTPHDEPFSFSDVPEQDESGFLPAANETVLLMTGRVEEPPETKSLESWYNGGPELVRDDVPVDHRGRAVRVALRATATFDGVDDIKAFMGKRVEIRGRMAGYVKVRVDPMSQYPIGHVDRDGYRLIGGGILVDSITELAEQVAK
jgi:hypothetical protein